MVGRHWWAQRWSQLLGDTAAPERLHRGRALARGGSVFRFRIETGEARAEVRHSRTELHEVVIRHAPLSSEQWEALTEVLVSKALYLGALLAGRLEEDLHERLVARGVEVFPSELTGMEMECSCTDPIAPCSHIAAVFYLVAERLDKDPFLLFRFRGRRRDLILAECRRLRSEHTLAAPKLGGDEPGDVDLGEPNTTGLSTTRYFGDPEVIAPFASERPAPDEGRPVLDELGPPPTVEPSSVSDHALREAYELGKSAAAGPGRVESPEAE
ncbi:MAG: hypothetical protein R3E97_12315 [Candidatus Eisenbacteria bacterium]